MGCYFYFLLVGSRRNECNSFWWREGGEVRRLLLTRKLSLSGIFIDLVSHGMNVIVFGKDQKVMTYSDVIFTMLNLFLSFTGDKMMPQAITLHGKFIIILSQYIIFLTRYPSE